MATKFYNKQNVTVGLWTDGDEYQTSLEYSGESYIGYYHIQDDYLYTDPAPIEYRESLYPYVIKAQTEVRKYNIIKDVTTPKHGLPLYHFPRPTDENIKQGWLPRYFVQRKPNRVITEISKKQYSDIGNGDTGIDKALYRKGRIRWKIAGTVPAIKFINSGKLQTLEGTMPGISDYLNNLLEFSEHVPIWANQ
jgi:hypothetical protein